jgi:hypothetical protein
MAKKLGARQNKLLKADAGRDKNDSLGEHEKRELARRQGSSKKRRGKT